MKQVAKRIANVRFTEEGGYKNGCRTVRTAFR